MGSFQLQRHGMPILNVGDRAELYVPPDPFGLTWRGTATIIAKDDWYYTVKWDGENPPKWLLSGHNTVGIGNKFFLKMS